MNSKFSRVACIGLPGSGKSTVGRHLSRRLGFKFVDSDHVIEQRLRCSIREYFEREGETAFRDTEQSVIDELTQIENCVLSTGGGAVLRAANQRCLHERTVAVYLHAHPKDIFHRLRHDRSRPLLQGHDPLLALTELYSVRHPLYIKTAHIVVDGPCASVSMLASKIIEQLDALNA